MSEKKSQDKLDAKNVPVNPEPQTKLSSIYPFKATIFSDKIPSGTDLMIAKVGRTGFLAWSTMPLYRNDICSLKSMLPVLDELVDMKTVVFKTYDRYGVGRAGHDQNYPHLSELVYSKTNDPGAKLFNELLNRIDSKTGVPLEDGATYTLDSKESDDKGED